ncbi:MAG: DNA mismatch endonuclease Vsr [Planctomycetia bacterium]|nr:DNA mismatch endonuclease Vsr [Planctomycetia bacterium]
MDNLSQAQRSLTMARIRSRDTEPEMIVRRLIHHLGFRYRLHDLSLPGRPDIVLHRLKKVVLVNGCFWHRHRCKFGRPLPATNRTYWRAKLQRNADRDRLNRRRLRRQGWEVLVLWECWTRRPDVVAKRLHQFLQT